MKSKSNHHRFCLTTIFCALASFAFAGPGPQFWNRVKPVTTTKDAAAVKATDSVVMVCGACKTAVISDAVYMRRTGAEIDDYGFEWLTIGSKHKCGHCGGEITVVMGKTTDSMQHNCSMCGEGAAFCCAVPARNPKK